MVAATDPKYGEHTALAAAQDPASAALHQAVERLRPPPNLSGHRAVRTRNQRMLRLVGRRSHMQHVGRVIGGEDPCTCQLWDNFASSRQSRTAAADLLIQHELDSATDEEVSTVKNLLERLLDPESTPLGLGLLRAVAKELHKYGSAADLAICWAWDAHAAENEFKLVWVVCMLLYAIIFTREQAGELEKIDAVECPIRLECYVNDPDVSFVGLHPCMHYVSEPGLRDVFAKVGDGPDDAKEARCPTCNEPILFAKRAGRLREAPASRPHTDSC